MEFRLSTDGGSTRDHLNKLRIVVHYRVFIVSTIIILAFILFTLINPAGAKTVFDHSKSWTMDHFDWFFMICANLFVLFCLALIVLPAGNIRLGGPDARPDFSIWSWLAMLFAAGMGVGLMFWSVAEPVAYYTDFWGTPLNVRPGTPEAARAAMGATMFHWGLHPWAMYAVVALSLSFFSYNRGLPLTIRSTFAPLLGQKIRGIPGEILDITAVTATISGLAASLGFGAQQTASGLHFLFHIPNTTGVQLSVILIVCMVAAYSVIQGLDKGVKVLSNINMIMAASLMLFVILTSSVSGFFTGLGNTVAAYTHDILSLSNWMGRVDDKFYKGWTVFYWAWWVSWAPFVGMFIARISRGRTIREFLSAVLLAPPILTLCWMQAFGGTALTQLQNHVGVLSQKGLGKISLATFQMLSNLPLHQITSLIGILLVLIFLITSFDSGSIVVDSITAGGKTDGPAIQRLFWVCMEGAIASALLAGGGADALGAIQALAITAGLPFAMVMLLMMICTIMGLRGKSLIPSEEG